MSAHPGDGPQPFEETETLRVLCSRMAEAANRYLESLSAAERRDTRHDFESPYRTAWNFLPFGSGGRRWGLSWHAMTPCQRAAATALLSTGLSADGLRAALDIIEVEKVQHPKHGVRSYSIWIFGDPSTGTDWMWRFEGHHLSLSFTCSRGEVIASTPAFWGLSPTRVRFALDSSLPVGRRVLAEIEDVSTALYDSLSERQRAATAIPLPNMDDRTAQEPAAAPWAECGAPLATLDSAQIGLARHLVQAHFRHYAAPIAQQLEQELLLADDEALYLAAAAAADGDRPRSARPDGFYLRLQGPRLLLEHDDVQFGAQGTGHIHTLLRNLGGDFGESRLRDAGANTASELRLSESVNS